MLNSQLAEVYEKLEGTSKRIEKTFIVSQFFKEVLKLLKRKELSEEQVKDITYLINGKIFPSWDESEIGISSKLAIKAISKSYGIHESEVVNEWKKVGDLGKVVEKLALRKKQSTLFSKGLTVEKVVSNLRDASKLEGKGTVGKKISLIAELLSYAKPIEARYVIRTVLEELRIGVGEGILRDAIVWATTPAVIPLFSVCSNCKAVVPTQKKCLSCGKKLVPLKVKAKKFSLQEVKELVKSKKIPRIIEAKPETEGEARKIMKFFTNLVQQAYDVTTDFGEVLLKANKMTLQETELIPGRSIKVMLALKVDTISEAFDKVGKPAQIEYKYDGFRVLIHKVKDEIKIFTRRLDNVTKQFPEIVKYAKNIKAKSFIIDGEAVGYNPKTKTYMPFQDVSQRIKRKYNIKEMQEKLPVEVNIFDLLYYDGKNMINEPLKKRRQILEKIIKPIKWHIVLAKKCVTSDEGEAERFYHEALAVGQEGVMFKNLKAPYKPGARVGYMIKPKPEKATLDLVIVGAEWGTGKRSGWLSSFTLACYDPENGKWLEVGKVGTGIKEKGSGLSFKKLMKMLKPLITESKGRSVKIRPQIVVEVMYQEIQKSPTYDSGYALRFPRVIKLRPDKSADDANTINMIIKYYKEQRKKK